MIWGVMNRRQFLALSAAAACASASVNIPIGLEMYSLRDDFKRDPEGTLRAVAATGFAGVEFYAPYFDWTVEQARTTRKLLDDLKLRCFSTHNGAKSFAPENIEHAVELNQVLGSRYLIWASAGKIGTLEGWKPVAETLSHVSDTLKQHGLRTGYHNHELEFLPAAHRISGGAHFKGRGAAIGPRYLRGGRFRPGCVDESKPGPD